MQLTEATLGIDLGSTSSRAFVWCPGNGAEYYVENKSRNNLSSTRYEKGDFSSTGNPFDDDGPVYAGETPNPDRQATSLKNGFYTLADASADELIEQYSLVRPLWERRNDPTFRARLVQGLRALLATIRRYVNQMCKAKRLSITKVGLSIPAQWTLEFENVYRDLVVDVFKHPPSEIYFHTETEALAHYLVKNHIDELNDEATLDVLLLLDFGGHNMNGCLFCVVYSKDGAPSFYGMGKPFGAGGGSEQWEYNIGDLCARYIATVHGYELSPRNKQALLDVFNRKKTHLGPGQGRSVTLISEDISGNPWKLLLDSQKIDECFNEALQRPLQVAVDRIAELSKITGSKRKVVVSGGTCRNESLKARLRRLCSNAGLPEPLFTDSLEINYESLKIAKGVAYAAGSSGTIEDFFRRGAAFGLQMKQCPTRGNCNPGRQWDDRAFFLFDKNHRTIRRVCVNGRDELRIVCDPFWAEKHDAELEEELPYNKCYNVLDLGKPTRGYWSLRISVVGSGDSMWLLIEGSRQPWGSRKRHNMVPKRLPLQFDRGTNCVYVGVRNHTLEELGLDTCLDSRDLTNADASTTNCAEDPTTSSAIEEGIARLESTESAEIELGQRPIDQEMGAQVNLAPTAERRAKPSGSLRCSRVDPYQRRQHPYRKPGLLTE